MPHLGMQELLIVLVIVLIFFGGRKLPDLARGLGEGLREFKKATKEPPVELSDPAMKGLDDKKDQKEEEEELVGRR